MVADSVLEALRRHPLDWNHGSVLLPVVVGLVYVPGQAKVRHSHSQSSVNPKERKKVCDQGVGVEKDFKRECRMMLLELHITRTVLDVTEVPQYFVGGILLVNTCSTVQVIACSSSTHLFRAPDNNGEKIQTGQVSIFR